MKLRVFSILAVIAAICAVAALIAGKTGDGAVLALTSITMAILSFHEN